MSRHVCMICGKGPVPLGQSGGVGVYRVNRHGITGVWTCKAHAIQAAQTYADQFGKDQLSEDAKKAVK